MKKDWVGARNTFWHPLYLSLPLFTQASTKSTHSVPQIGPLRGHIPINSWKCDLFSLRTSKPPKLSIAIPFILDWCGWHRGLGNSGVGGRGGGNWGPYTTNCVPYPSVMGQSGQPWLFWLPTYISFEMHPSNPRSVEIWCPSYPLALEPLQPMEVNGACQNWPLSGDYSFWEGCWSDWMVYSCSLWRVDVFRPMGFHMGPGLLDPQWLKC